MENDLTYTLQQRGGRYGDFSDVSRTAQALKHALYTSNGFHRLGPTHMEALDMICNKLARIVNGDPNYVDSWHDIAGYATLVVMRLGEDK